MNDKRAEAAARELWEWLRKPGFLTEWMPAAIEIISRHFAPIVDENERLKADFESLQCVMKGDYWNWQGDVDDHPESLTCRVIMTAEQVRSFVSDRSRLAKIEEAASYAARFLREIGADYQAIGLENALGGETPQP